MLESSLITLQGPRTIKKTLKKRLQHRFFPVNFVNYSKTSILCRGSMNGWFWNTSVPFFKNTSFYRTSPVAASVGFRLQSCNFIKKETPAKTFFCEFCKIFKNSFWQNTSGWLLLVFICESWEVFQITSFIEHLSETAYFMYKLQNFNHQYNKKYFTSAFQAFYTKIRLSYSKAFIYLKSLKIICE